MAKWFSKSNRRKILVWVLPHLVYLLVRLLFLTCKKEFHSQKNGSDTASIYTAWHGELLMMVFGYKYYTKRIDIDAIIKTITEKFQSSKLTIPIQSNSVIGSSENIQIDSVTYKVNRVAQFVIEITNLTNPEWVVDKLIVQVKDLDGVIVYPTISTKNSKITVHFIDGILTNYYVIVI